MSIAVQAYRKLQKKREKEKHKKARQEVREAAKLLLEPEKLKKELDELSHKSIIGRIDEEATRRKDKLEKLWEQHSAKAGVAALQEAVRDARFTLSTDDESTDSSDDSGSDDASDSDDAPKCVIEIGNKVIAPSRNNKHQIQQAAPDDNGGEDTVKTGPYVTTTEAEAEADKGNASLSSDSNGIEPHGPKRRHMMQKEPIVVVSPSFSKNYPFQPPLPASNVAVIPPPPPPPPPSTNPLPTRLPEKPSTVLKKDDTKEKAVLFSSYLVPTQVRMKHSKRATHNKRKVKAEGYIRS